MKNHCSIGIALLIAAAGCNDNDTPVARAGVSASPRPPAPLPSQATNCSTLDFRRTSDIDAMPGGIWQGTFANCARATENEVATAVVGEDGRFRIIDSNNHALVGAMKTDGNTFYGSGVDFVPHGGAYFSGSTTGMFVSGLIAERRESQGRWGTEWADYGFFRFDYMSNSYERPTPLEDLAGTWQSHVEYFGSPVEGEWQVLPDGSFSGNDTRGCQQRGLFSLIDDRYSLVAVDYVVSGCDLAGTYEGLAHRQDHVDSGARNITLYVDDGERAWTYSLLLK